MKILSTLSILCLLPLSGGQIYTDYTGEETLRIECETTVFLETIDFSMERNGEPVESRGGLGGGDVELTRIVVQLDRVVAHADDLPTEVERSFESVSGEAMYGGEGRSLDAPLDGVTLKLTLDGDGEAQAEADGGAVDDGQLQGHELTLALDALFPDDEVEPGDSWEIDGDALMHALGLDLEEVLFPLPEPEERSSGEGGRGRGRGGPRGNPFARLTKGAEWEVTVRLTDETSSVGGFDCLVLEFEAEASGTLEDPVRSGGGRGRAFGSALAPALASGLASGLASAAALDTEFQIDLKGQLDYSSELHRPLQLVVEGSFDMERASSFERGEMTMAIYQLQEGTFDQKVTISVE